MMPLWLPPILAADFYKLSHPEQYPKGTELVYSTWTPRASRVEFCDEVIAFGFQPFLCEMNDFFNEGFFFPDLDHVVEEYREVVRHALGIKNPDTSRLEALHAVGHLPLEFRAVPEGTRVPLRCPVLTVHNTDPNFGWLTNSIETLMSCELWQSSTSATLADRYRRILDAYAAQTCDSNAHVSWQGHDFSMRGMSSLIAAARSGAGHLLSFYGTDTIPAIMLAQNYYDAQFGETPIGGSIPATEHSVQCTYRDDRRYFEAMLDLYQTGIFSIVSDGYDFWAVMTELLPALKQRIVEREGKVVIRPDSGDPVLIVCGDPNAATEHERKGAVQVLWDLFGGRVNSKGFKELASCIGLIYGDAITAARAEEICVRLRDAGFASNNIVFGIGSFTYQYVTRDTFGWAMKSTLCRVNGEEIQIYKDPKTDNGIKKSQRGGVRVYRDGNGAIQWQDGLSFEQTKHNTMLQPIYRDGEVFGHETFAAIRDRVGNL